MRTVRLAAVGFILTAIFAVSAFAQTAPGKIGLINQASFLAEKGGITKLVAAYTALEAEFKPAMTEGQGLLTRQQNLAAEIKKLQDQLAAPPTAVPIDKTKLQDQLSTKIDEYQNLELTIKRKQEDLKVKSDKRAEIVLGPIQDDIAIAVNEYAKKNGYALILNGNRLQESQILMGWDPAVDVTQSFITFYNARTPATASAAKPQ
jgi:Skp family chaperone for outer membrane proteins